MNGHLRRSDSGFLHAACFFRWYSLQLNIGNGQLCAASYLLPDFIRTPDRFKSQTSGGAGVENIVIKPHQINDPLMFISGMESSSRISPGCITTAEFSVGTNPASPTDPSGELGNLSINSPETLPFPAREKKGRKQRSGVPTLKNQTETPPFCCRYAFLRPTAGKKYIKNHSKKPANPHKTLKSDKNKQCRFLCGAGSYNGKI